MPDIDVTDILDDPLVAGEGFWVYRRSQTVGDNGRAVLAGAWLPAIGSVTPTGDQSLTRADAFQTQARTIDVVTTFRLRGVSRTERGVEYQPDMVFWDGDFFVVKDLSDYSRYGAGMMEAECTSVDYKDRPAELPSGAVPGEADFSRAANSGLVSGE